MQLSNELFTLLLDDNKYEIMNDIMSQICNVLVANYDIDYQLYKLNFMSQGGFFKSHIDTPHNESFFASLVICLPIATFEGGKLYN